eukprot:UN28951
MPKKDPTSEMKKITTTVQALHNLGVPVVGEVLKDLNNHWNNFVKYRESVIAEVTAKNKESEALKAKKKAEEQRQTAEVQKRHAERERQKAERERQKAERERQIAEDEK